jgi:hypothetical protein
MNPIPTSLQPVDFVILAAIVFVITGFTARAARQRVFLGSVERQVQSLQQKLDALLAHHGIRPPPPPPSGLSPEVERLARSPDTKIAAIRLYRDQNPGVGLAEAKARIEAFADRNP